MADLSIATLIVLVALFSEGVIFYFYTRANENRRKAEDALKRIDELEHAQRETRLPYKVAEDNEDITAIAARLLRDIADFKRYHADVDLWINFVNAELEKVLDKSRQIRQNGQKTKGNGK